jgi:hypothetical protein
MSVNSNDEDLSTEMDVVDDDTICTEERLSLLEDRNMEAILMKALECRPKNTKKAFEKKVNS